MWVIGRRWTLGKALLLFLLEQTKQMWKVSDEEKGKEEQAGAR